MDKIDIITEEAIKRYFNSLFKFGYKKYADVDRLLVLIFLNDCLSYDYLGFITEDDYRNIMRAISVLTRNTCLIDFPSYDTYDNIIRKQTVSINPITSEFGIFRMCEKSLLKVKM